VLGLQNGEVSLVDDKTGKEEWRIKEFHPAANRHHAYDRGISLSTSIDGEYIAMVDRSSKNWKIFKSDGTNVNIVDGNMGKLESITCSPSNGLIAVISMHRKMKMFDAKTYKELWELKETANMSCLLYCASFTSDSTLVAAVSRDGAVQIKYSTTGVAFKNLLMDGTGCFCPTNNNLFSSTDGDNLALWNIASDERIWQIELGRDDFMEIVNFARFSPDGKTIATVQQDERVEFLEPDTVSYAGSESDSDSEVDSGSGSSSDSQSGLSESRSDSKSETSSDGKFEEADNKVIVVNAENGETKFSLNHQRFTSIYDAAFSPDGLRLACVGSYRGDFGICVLWNMVNGNAICSINPEPEIRSVVWLVDQTRRAVAMSLIARLGENSHIGKLDPEVIRRILLDVEGLRITEPDPPGRRDNDLDTISQYEI